jgi:hypothetical protein
LFQPHKYWIFWAETSKKRSVSSKILPNDFWFKQMDFMMGIQAVVAFKTLNFCPIFFQKLIFLGFMVQKRPKIWFFWPYSGKL